MKTHSLFENLPEKSFASSDSENPYEKRRGDENNGENDIDWVKMTTRLSETLRMTTILRVRTMAFNY